MFNAPITSWWTCVSIFDFSKLKTNELKNQKKSKIKDKRLIIYPLLSELHFEARTYETKISDPWRKMNGLMNPQPKVFFWAKDQRSRNLVNNILRWAWRSHNSSHFTAFKGDYHVNNNMAQSHGITEEDREGWNREPEGRGYNEKS